jgi:hypothetical protein
MFSIYLILPAVLGSEINSTPNRNEYKNQKKMFLGIRERLAYKADKFTTTCEPIVEAMRYPRYFTNL